MYQEIGAVLGQRATARLATSALPDAPVLPVPRRRPHPMFVKLFLEVSEEERTVNRGRRARPRMAVRVTARDRGRRAR